MSLVASWDTPGFTLWETLLTLLLLSLAAGYLAVRWPQVDTPYFRAQQFAAHLRLTQTLAMSRGGVWRITLFDPDGYQLFDRFGQAASPRYSLGQVQWLAMASTRIQFSQNGQLQSGSGSYVLGTGESRQEVRVEENTGTVVIPP